MIDDVVSVFDKWLDSKLRNVHTILPGQIDLYYGHSERKAKVKPLIKLKTADNKDIQIQPIDNVPVIFPSCQDFSLLFPLKKGDGVLLLFSECPMGNYLNTKIEQTSDDLRRFSLSDCIAIPGLFSFKNVPSSELATIEITETGEIIINNGTEPFVKGTALNTWIVNILLSVFNTHTHTETGGTTTTPNSILTAPSNYLSQKIKGN